MTNSLADNAIFVKTVTNSLSSLIEHS